MIWWIIIAALVLMFILTTFVKLEHDLKTVKMIILVVLLFVIAGSIYGWIKSDNIDFSSPKGIIGAVYSYAMWLGDTGIKLWDVTKTGAGTVGNAINTNPNSTIKASNSKDDGRK